MMDQDVQKWFDQVLGEARSHGVRDVEMAVAAGESSLTRFANNTIHQNVSEESCGVSIRVSIGKRTARASTNRLDRLAAATRSAIDLARASEPDDHLLPLFAPEPVTPINRWDPATAACSPASRAGAVRDAIAIVESSGHIAAGIYETVSSRYYLLNSNGVFARHDETGATFSITATARDSSGWAKQSAVHASALDTAALARQAAMKASRSASPRRMDPGCHRVLLEPAAVLDFVGQIFPDCSATAIEEERSFLTGRRSDRIFGENITILDDVRHPHQDGAPFDGEGVPRRALTLFRNGVPDEMPASRASAARLGAPSTGHGLSLPNESGEAVSNVIVEGGVYTREALCRQLGRGILVTRLWYIREVDPFRKIMTGMTRDGTFLVEDGEIVCGLHNFRFNESVIDALNRVEAMSPSERASGEEAFDMVVPAMLIDGFQFSEVTLF